MRATLEVPSDQAGAARLLQLATAQAPAGGSGPWKGRAAMGLRVLHTTRARASPDVQRVLAARQDAKQLEAEPRQLVTVMTRPCSASPGIALSCRIA